MKFAILATLIAAASAFAPSSRIVSRTSSLKMTDFSNEAGVTKPLGLFDPLGLLKNADQERFEYLRSAEKKHGRVAMMAGEYFIFIGLFGCFVVCGGAVSSPL